MLTMTHSYFCICYLYYKVPHRLSLVKECQAKKKNRARRCYLALVSRASPPFPLFSPTFSPPAPPVLFHKLAPGSAGRLAPCRCELKKEDPDTKAEKSPPFNSPQNHIAPSAPLYSFLKRTLTLFTRAWKRGDPVYAFQLPLTPSTCTYTCNILHNTMYIYV